MALTYFVAIIKVKHKEWSEMLEQHKTNPPSITYDPEQIYTQLMQYIRDCVSLIPRYKPTEAAMVSTKVLATPPPTQQEDK